MKLGRGTTLRPGIALRCRIHIYDGLRDLCNRPRAEAGNRNYSYDAFGHTFITSGSTTPNNYRYRGKLTEHNGHEAIRIQPTDNLPTNGPNPTHGGAWFAQGDLVHQAGINNFTGVGRDGRAVSNGCLVVCTSQFGDFSTATGMNASPPQRHFTVDVDTSVNQLNVSQ